MNDSATGAPTEPPPGPSADAQVQVKAQRFAARLAAGVGILVALLALGGNVFLALHNGTTTQSPRVARKVVLGQIQTPSDGSSISGYIDISGSVSGLKPGEMVWTFNVPYNAQGAPSGSYFPNTGPCNVESGTWHCNHIAIGAVGPGSSHNLGRYDIWATVVSDSDAFSIVNTLRCFVSGILVPDVRGVKIEPVCPSSLPSLPGQDIVTPQHITVTRTR